MSIMCRIPYIWEGPVRPVAAAPRASLYTESLNSRWEHGVPGPQRFRASRKWEVTFWAPRRIYRA